MVDSSNVDHRAWLSQEAAVPMPAVLGGLAALVMLEAALIQKGLPESTETAASRALRAHLKELKVL